MVTDTLFVLAVGVLFVLPYQRLAIYTQIVIQALNSWES
jgi:hypothetical protein